MSAIIARDLITSDKKPGFCDKIWRNKAKFDKKPGFWHARWGQSFARAKVQCTRSEGDRVQKNAFKRQQNL
ncbi:MAG: hypothetical protein AB4352_22815 [Hormoscilla sp.]